MNVRHSWLLALVFSAASALGCSQGPPSASQGTTRSTPVQAENPSSVGEIGTAPANGESRGVDGASCYSNGACNSGLVCRKGVCATCTPGAPGCACDGDRCSDGLACLGGSCRRPLSAMTAKTTTCYTPCTTPGQQITDSNGQPHTCIDGVFEGVCLSNLVCNDGSCVPPGTDPPSCTVDSNCPSWQVCYPNAARDGGVAPGRCYSNCSDTLDCDTGLVCHQHACRKPCPQQTCTAGTELCDTSGQDGTGVCMPLSTTDAGASPPPVLGTFLVSPGLLPLSNISVRLPFKITNNSPQGIDFHVKKIAHTDVGAPQPDKPLPWLAIGPPGDAKNAKTDTEQVFRIGANNNTSSNFVSLEVSIAAGQTPPDSDEGVIEISSKELGTHRVAVTYTRTADSRWSGKAYYFSRFGDANIETWMRRRSSTQLLTNVGNAFVQRWGAFRTGGMSTSDELDAVLQATIQGTWKLAGSDLQACAKLGGAECYPYSPQTTTSTTDPGLRVYTTDLTAFPIPNRPTELPVALDLQLIGMRTLKGKIASEVSLQYPGDPAITISLDKDITTCLGNRTSPCIATINSLSGNDPLKPVTATIGARMAATDTGTCISGFAPLNVPWLLHDFTHGTLDPAQGSQDRYKIECRDPLLPFDATASGSDVLNKSLAAANPIPDGRSRQRTIELVDGALVNKNTIYLLFRERFDDKFLGGTSSNGFFTYGMMVLHRSDAQVASFVGNDQSDSRNLGTDPSNNLSNGVQCSRELLNKVDPAAGGTLTAANAAGIAQLLLNGNDLQGGGSAPYYDPVVVHYFCATNGTFDQDCPVGSNVVYFTGNGFGNLAGNSCNQAKSCAEELDKFRKTPSYAFVDLSNFWKCSDPTHAVYCDADRSNLKTGKLFLQQVQGTIPMLDLLTEIDRAFRYKTQFRSRDSNATVGFAPQVCIPNSSEPPYCYDVDEIRETTARVDCLMRIYSDDTTYKPLGTDLQEQVRSYLVKNFSYDTEITTAPDPIKHDGLDPMNAELLVMLGDEAYTSAVRERLDLAGSNAQTFHGESFEPDGIQLSGGAGFEMYKLHQATQYYQMALDRFYAVVPLLWTSLQSGTKNYVVQQVVTSYLPRLLRASTQKAVAWSEIGKRYQQQMRADLGRRVVQRAYIAAHLESVILSRMMQNVVTVSTQAERDQVVTSLDAAREVYHQALLDMGTTIAGFTDEISYFGYPPGYVPFPAEDKANLDEVELALASADNFTSKAGTDELNALNDTQKYDTDSKEFQAQLESIRTKYEDQLGELCGRFSVSGAIYPAIPKYAYLDPRAKALGNPCGLMGTGLINDAVVDLETKQIDIQAVHRQSDKIQQQTQNEIDRINNLCSPSLPDGGKGVIMSYADVKFGQAQTQRNLKVAIEDQQLAMAELDRTNSLISTELQLASCVKGVATDCDGKAAGASAWGTVIGVSTFLAGGLQAGILSAQTQLEDAQLNGVRVDITQQCAVEQVNSNATLKNIALQGIDLDLQVLKADYAARLALSHIVKLHNDADALLAEQTQAEALAIDVEAAKNDPNVRIYKDSIVIQSDRTFNLALKAAYEATLVYQYYAAQSYAGLGKLAGMRMVTKGDYPLTQYLIDLRAAYDSFKKTFGKPQSRVLVLSLMDDILNISRVAPDGTALTVAQRQDLLRAAVTDPARIDARGWITFPFSTSLKRLSPITSDHKILSIQAEIGATRRGDAYGDLYLHQLGTSTVRSLTTDLMSYRLPTRRAVLNVFFNGYHEVGLAGYYDNTTLQDFPVVNGDWELSLNQVDETENQDIDLSTMTDIKLYVAYTDFTQQR